LTSSTSQSHGKQQAERTAQY